MENNQLTDQVLEQQASAQLVKYYVNVVRGCNEYFTNYQAARKFADIIGSEVKPLD